VNLTFDRLRLNYVDLSDGPVAVTADPPSSTASRRSAPRGQRVYMLELAIAFALGFAVGYGVREWKSRKR
jgi:hypothetical protein